MNFKKIADTSFKKETCKHVVNAAHKGCVRYIFAGLFCISKKAQFRNKEKCFLFHCENSFRS